MIAYRPGDIILVRYPFSDLTTTKKRPAVIISPTEYLARHHDVVVMAITGVAPPSDNLKLRFWKTAGLLKPSWLKPALATISNEVIERRLGKISLDDVVCVTRAIRQSIIAKFRN